ncbi:MAG: 50S ribosomal protein L29 [Patescibacteria group bacterium]|nr:50S ribosomal protein L29 [Patescibacteria group bacterium]
MKKKELQSFKNKPLVELDKELRMNRERLNSLRLDLSLGKVKNISEIRKIKKSIAQFLTLKRLIKQPASKTKSDIAS